MYARTFESMPHVLNALLFRLASVILYIEALNHKAAIRTVLTLLPRNPILLAQVLVAATKRYLLHLRPFRSFFILGLGSVLLLPVYRSLAAEIDTDTIWFNFLICQVVYCVSAVNSSLLGARPPRRTFERERVIPLEEGLLLTRQFHNTPSVPCIAAALGHIFMFSRFQTDLDVFIFQLMAVLLYAVVPSFAESSGLHKSRCWTGAYFVLAWLVLYTGKDEISRNIRWAIASMAMYCALFYCKFRAKRR